jgi:regulator of sigma D
MRVAKTKLDEAAIAKIEASGKTIYQFLQEAVSLKLQNENAININDSLDRRLKEFEKRFEDKLIQGVDASRKIYEASVAKDEEVKLKISEHLKKIALSIKGA